MKKELDIDKYIDGFDAKRVDCIQSPIAAAAGFLDRDNYFYYCYLYSFMKYFDVKKIVYNKPFIEATNTILSSMDLSIKSFEYGEDYDLAINNIKKLISNNKPVYIVCKYNTLFYNSYYGNKHYFRAHGILVSGFNDENDTFIINESTLLSTLLKNPLLSKQDNTDVFFPLQVKSSVVREIIMDSNLQFKNSPYEHANYESRIFYIDSEKANIKNSRDILKFSLELLKDTEPSNQFIELLEGKNPELFADGEKFLSNLLFSNCVWGLIPVFRLLHMHAQGNVAIDERVSSLEKRLLFNKNKAVTSVVKALIQRVEITEEQEKIIKNIIEEWKNDDLKLLELIKELSEIKIDKEYEYKSIDISENYNCRAFEESISDNSKADLTGEGTHYLFENIKPNSTWKNNDYQFVYNYTSGDNDNMSCEGQKILITNQFEASSISFLECAEYGSFQEKIVINYVDGRTFDLTAVFSDFYQAPIYNEKVFWTGTALDRKNNKTIVHNFSARLLAKRYDIPKGIISSIQFPNKRNIHIFAVTLEKIIQ